MTAKRRTYYSVDDNGGALIAQVRGTSGAFAPDDETGRKAVSYIRRAVKEDPDLLIEILGLTEHDKGSSGR